MTRINPSITFLQVPVSNGKGYNSKEIKQAIDNNTSASKISSEVKTTDSIPNCSASITRIEIADNTLDKILSDFKLIAEEIQASRLIWQFLNWDMQTTMPIKASDSRAWQMMYLKKLEHEKLSSDELGNCIKKLEKESVFKKLDVIDQALVKELRREYNIAKKVPTELVEELADITAKAHYVWVRAREKNDFNSFIPYLEKIISLKRQKAELVGYKGSPYNVMLDEYEPDITTQELDEVFNKLRTDLIPILKAIKTSNVNIDNSFINKTASEEKLKELSEDILDIIGFDLSKGRLARSDHPFTMIIGENDIGIASRFKSIWETIADIAHEGGHGIHYQGFDKRLAKTPLYDGASFAIEESQALLYEEMIVRGLPFCNYYFPKLQKLFPEIYKNITVEQFYKGINKINPTSIRDECGELTYSLHIAVCYEIERDFIEGKLAVKDIPKVWKEKTEQAVGIIPRNDSEGALQHVHWSCGDIGYVPTYALGNLYAAQFYNTAKKEIPDLEKQISEGNTKPLREWLKEKIHKYGRMETQKEIVKRVTGEPLNPKYFIDYIKEKYSKIYNVAL